MWWWFRTTEKKLDALIVSVNALQVRIEALRVLLNEREKTTELDQIKHS